MARTSGSDGDGTQSHPDYAYFLAEGLSPEDAGLLVSALVSREAAGLHPGSVVNFVRAATNHGLDDINGRLLAANGDADEAWETWAKHDWDSHPDYAYFLESGFDPEDAYLLLSAHVSREAARLGPGSVCDFLSAASYHSLDDINGRLLAANGDGYQAWETWAEEENALNRLAEEEE